MKVARIKIWWLETRPHFLLLTPVCVFAGIAASVYDGHPFNFLYFLLAFVGALLAHISVNVLNDYFDYRSGIDLKVERTPFSGGSGILPSALLKPKDVYLFGLVSLGLVVLIGVYFVFIYGWPILILGLMGVFLIFFYTILLAKLYILSEISAGAFALIVFGTYFVQNGSYSWVIVTLTLISWLLIANLLLLNEFPDVEADRTDGRKHIPIVLGKKKAAKVYCSIMVSVYVLTVGGIIVSVLPLAALLGLATLPLALKAMRGALRYHSNTTALIPYLGTNVQVVLLTPILISVGVISWAVLF